MQVPAGIQSCPHRIIRNVAPQILELLGIPHQMVKALLLPEAAAGAALWSDPRMT
jgi:hypothetical protein